MVGLMEKAEMIARKARKSISRYCYEECNAYCCRKGFLVLNGREINKVTQGRRNELIKLGILKMLPKGSYSLYMGRYDTPCPSLKENKCTIHKSKNRPETCGKFPLYLEGKEIRLAMRCPAVKEGKLYPYVVALIRMGYHLRKECWISDTELYNFEIPKLPAVNPIHKNRVKVK